MKKDAIKDIFEQLHIPMPDFPSPRSWAGEFVAQFNRAGVTDEMLIKSYIELGHELTEYRNRIKKLTLWDRIDFSLPWSLPHWSYFDALDRLRGSGRKIDRLNLAHGIERKFRRMAEHSMANLYLFTIALFLCRIHAKLKGAEQDYLLAVLFSKMRRQIGLEVAQSNALELHKSCGREHFRECLEHHFELWAHG